MLSIDELRTVLPGAVEVEDGVLARLSSRREMRVSRQGAVFIHCVLRPPWVMTVDMITTTK